MKRNHKKKMKRKILVTDCECITNPTGRKKKLKKGKVFR